MKIIVDADACPVKQQILKIAKGNNIKVIMVCDTSHVISDGYSEVITVDKGSDSADFKIVSIAEKGDVVVTGDYGVAAMALSKGATPISNNGIVFTNFNIDSYLAQRHMAKENRRKGGKFSKIKKRTTIEDNQFIQVLSELVKII